MISTHTVYKKLVQNGMSEKLAETMTEVMEERQDGLVTKSDLKAELTEVRSDMKWLKTIGFFILGLLIKIAFFST